MAGEGRAAQVKYIVNDGGLQFPVIGTADTIAHARTEAQKKLALTVGDEVIRGTESTPLDSGALAALVLAAGADGDLVLEMQCQDDAQDNFGKFAVLRMRGVTTAVLLPGSPNIVNMSNADIIALATAYYDSDANNGYVPIRGELKP